MLLVAFSLVYALAWFGALYGLPEIAEHELQLFMASHYVEAPFSLWDARWYGGFDVAWRPPAFYVLSAIGAPVVGLDRAYALLVIATAVAVVAAAAWVAKVVAPGREGVVALFVALNPLLYLYAFSLGQAPFVLALACALVVFAASRQELLGVAAAAAVLAPLCHPLGWPLALIAWRPALRTGVVALAALAISLVVLSPLLGTIRSGGGGPVAHDKWLLVASVAVLIVLARFAPTRVVWGVAAAGLLGATFVLGDHAHAGSGRRYREAVASVEGVLSRPEAKDYRYLTFGLGSERLALSRRAKALLADGAIPWHTRTLLGAKVSADSVDALPLSQAQQVLKDAESQSLRWIVAASASEEPKAFGYRIAAAFSGGVVLWEKDVPPIPAPAPRLNDAVLWTLATPLTLLVGAAFAMQALRRSRRRAPES